MSYLSNVFLVSGLKANLSSISQLCDSQHEVQLSLNECVIVDKKGKNVLHGKRTSYNCYVLQRITIWHVTLPELVTLICGINDWAMSIIRTLKIWLKMNWFVGYPNVWEPRTVCVACVRWSSHKKVDSLPTTRPLVLLHLDLLCPTKTESIGRKKYIFLTVDDFSRLTWVRFLPKPLKLSLTYGLYSLLMKEIL